MNKTILGLISLLLIVSIGGCAGKTTISEYYPIDRKDKSITVPAGGNEVYSLIKQGLIKDGWDLQVDDSALLTKKSSKSETTTIEYKTKYRLIMTMYIDGEGVGSFNLSVIDNKTGKEAMTMFKPAAVGRETPKEVAERILNWFLGKVTT